jgi:hypothetical protein
MIHRAVRLMAVIALSGAAAACSGPEQKVVDNYFNAVKAQDNQTLSSFAAVTFKEPVDSWKVLGSRDEPASPASLPQLATKVRDLETQVAANKKEAGTFSLQHYADIEKVRDLRKKSAAVPAALAATGTTWDKFNETDRDLKKQLAGARADLEREKRAVRLSVGEVDGVEDLPGEVQTKVVDVEVVSKGQTKPYILTLRRYELKREGGPRTNSRWVVQDLKPKA